MTDLVFQTLVRQSLYYNYDYYHSLGKGAFSDSDQIQRWHVCELESSLPLLRWKIALTD